MASEFEGRRVAAIVALLVVLTAVLPPAAAYTLARSRISRAQALASDAAGQLTSRKPELLAAAGTHAVVAGNGRLPHASDDGLGWLQAPVPAGRELESIWPLDPWGRAYLLNARAVLAGDGGLLISAGPNGSIDTPLDASSPAGDDIAAIVR